MIHNSTTDQRIHQSSEIRIIPRNGVEQLVRHQIPGNIDAVLPVVWIQGWIPLICTGKSFRIEFAEVYFIIQRIAAHMAFIGHLCLYENDFTLYRQPEAQFSASGFYEIHCLS